MEKEKFATEICTELKAQAKRWRFAFLSVLLAEVLTVIVFYVVLI